MVSSGYFSHVFLPPILLSVIPEAGLDIDFTPNATVFAYMFLISLITGVVFGLAPAIQSTKPNLTDALKSTRNRPRALAATLAQSAGDWPGRSFAGAADRRGLLVRGLQRAQSTDLGFDQKNLVVVTMDLTTQGYDEARAATFHAQLSERLKALPGIKSVSLAQTVPFAGGRDETIDIEGGGSALSVSANEVSAEYFQTLGIPLRRGRYFTDEDARGGQSPAVISQAMANRFWPGADPIGKRFRDNAGTSHEIIGVVADISSRQIGKLDGPFFYTPCTRSQPS